MEAMPAAAQRRPHSGLLSLDDASLLHVGLFLTAPDLLDLAFTCRRFGCRTVVVAPTASASEARGLLGQRMLADDEAAPPPHALTEEAARLQLLQRGAASRAALSARRSTSCWLGWLFEMEQLEAPLAFTRVGPRVSLRDDGLLVTRSGVTCHGGHRAAMVGDHRMRAGRHYASFTLVEGATALVGLCPASFDPSTGNGCHFEHWMLHLQSGLFVKGRRSFPNIVGGWKRPRAGVEWRGMATATHGDRVGLLLDVDSRTLAVYLNERRLGACAFPVHALAKELEQQRPLVWAVDLGQQPGVFSDAVCIAAASEIPPPPPPAQLQGEGCDYDDDSSSGSESEGHDRTELQSGPRLAQA